MPHTPNWQIIQQLFETISERKTDGADNSYTASLFAKGTEKIAQKLGEEATETVIAAVTNDKPELLKESADLLYHLLVLWAQTDIEPQEVLEILEKRSGISGLDEKASRTQS